MFQIILDDIFGLNYDPSRLLWQVIDGSITRVSATCCKLYGQTLGTRDGMGADATKVLDFNGRLVGVKRLEDEEEDKPFLIAR